MHLGDTILKARESYMALKDKLSHECEKFGIDRAARDYYDVFKEQLGRAA